MYFASRLQAGRMLASQISRKYAGQNCAVVALSDGGVVVGAQIAMEMQSVISLLLADHIDLPREVDAVGGITEDGSFSYNQAFSVGEIDEMVSEYRGLIEQQKLEKLHEMNRSISGKRLIRQDLLVDHHVILVSDGLASGFSIDLAMQYLKPIAIKSIIVATPFASAQAVDRIHILADDIFCIKVLEYYVSTNHYYESKDVPSHAAVLATVEKIVSEWHPQVVQKQQDLS